MGYFTINYYSVFETNTKKNKVLIIVSLYLLFVYKPGTRFSCVVRVDSNVTGTVTELFSNGQYISDTCVAFARNQCKTPLTVSSVRFAKSGHRPVENYTCLCELSKRPERVESMDE